MKIPIKWGCPRTLSTKNKTLKDMFSFQTVPVHKLTQQSRKASWRRSRVIRDFLLVLWHSDSMCLSICLKALRPHCAWSQRVSICSLQNCHPSKSVMLFLKTLKSGIDFASLWLSISGIRFQNREVQKPLRKFDVWGTTTTTTKKNCSSEKKY